MSATDVKSSLFACLICEQITFISRPVGLDICKVALRWWKLYSAVLSNECQCWWTANQLGKRHLFGDVAVENNNF